MASPGGGEDNISGISDALFREEDEELLRSLEADTDCDTKDIRDTNTTNEGYDDNDEHESLVLAPSARQEQSDSSGSDTSCDSDSNRRRRKRRSKLESERRQQEPTTNLTQEVKQPPRASQIDAPLIPDKPVLGNAPEATQSSAQRKMMNRGPPGRPRNHAIALLERRPPPAQLQIPFRPPLRGFAPSQAMQPSLLGPPPAMKAEYEAIMSRHRLPRAPAPQQHQQQHRQQPRPRPQHHRRNRDARNNPIERRLKRGR